MTRRAFQTTVPLDAIAAALAASDRVAALTAAIAAWRTCRAKPLATLIDVLSADVSRGRAPIVTDTAYATAWMAVAAAGDPADLDRLVGGVTDGPPKSADDRIRTLIARGPDPRTGRALIRVLAAQPFPAGTMAGFWNDVFRAVPTMIDASARASLTAIARPEKPAEFRARYGRWLTETIDALPPVAKLGAADAARTKTLIARARILAAGPPLPITTATPPTAGRELVTPWQVALERAVAAAAARDWEAALELALDAWAPSRDPILGDLVVLVGELGGRDLPAVETAAWLATEATHRAVDVPRLLAADCETSSEAILRDQRLVRRRPDPRLGRDAALLLGVTDAGRWAARMAVLAQHGALADFADIKQWAGSTVDAHTARHFPTHRPRQRAAAAVVAGMTAAFADIEPLDPAGRAVAMAALDTVRANLPARAAHPEAGFIADILAHPADDAPRLVYADWLTEHGDPWGELIVVQCNLVTKPTDKKLLARHKKLLAQLSTLLAPLPYISRSDLVIERGAIVAFELSSNIPTDRYAALGHPRLGTAERISVADADVQLLALFDANPMPALRTVTDASFTAFSALAMRANPVGIHEIATNVDYTFELPDEDRARVAAGRGLPNLRTLRLSFEVPPPLWLFEGALAARLERVVLLDWKNYDDSAETGWHTVVRAIRERKLPIRIESAEPETASGSYVIDRDGVCVATIDDEPDADFVAALQRVRPVLTGLEFAGAGWSAAYRRLLR